MRSPGNRELIKNQKINSLRKWREADADPEQDGHLAQSRASIAKFAKKSSRQGKPLSIICCA
jgi:hypothetical protein